MWLTASVLRLSLLFAFQALSPAPAQEPTVRALLEAEHARGEDVAVLIAGTRSADPRLQRLAVRALGRFERPALATAVEPLLRARDATVRAEAVNALAQMRAPYAYASLLAGETDGAVRGVILESIGRVTPTPDGAERTLVAGLADSAIAARAGAARGLESLLRRTARTARPAEATVVALRRAAVDVAARGAGTLGADMRELAMLALTAAGDRDSVTIAAALRDPSEQVRRVAAALARRWIDDPHPIVRLQVLRSGGSCERFAAAMNDSSEHVALLAIDLAGERPCSDAVGALIAQADRGLTWRTRAHAVAALAKAAPDAARARLATLATSTTWQARTYAAAAAKSLGDSATLSRLARDGEPNVAIAAMTGVADAERALAGSHGGLVLAAAERLKGAAELPRTVPAMRAALDRFTRMGRATLRDPRVGLLERIDEATRASRDSAVFPLYRTLLGDADPAVAALAARFLSERTGSTVSPRTTRYVPAPLPAEAFMRGLQGAQAVVRIRGVGEITVDLLSEHAPVAVATFASLAESGKYAGLTFHRIVPNFVVQGGSPGADEYDPVTDTFMRDEVGLARNARGTFGISTRGRDTGDGQIYANLIDNFRLDHDYTVFARTTRGLDVMDRIQEGDVIESVRIVRRTASGREDQEAERTAAVTVAAVKAAGAPRGPAASDTMLRGVRSPGWAADGRLAFAAGGDLFVQRAPGAAPTRLTADASWDRDPVWTRDGTALLFASDRDGSYDLWRLPIMADGPAGIPERVAGTNAHETMPTVAPDGAIAFVRGLGNASRVWLRTPDGTERRLDSANVSQLAPAFSPDGGRIAYLSASEAGRRVIVRSVRAGADGAPQVASSDRPVDRIAWSPSGDRLALSTRTGIWIVPPDGRWANFASSHHGDLAWSADGGVIAVAEYDETLVGYNGDPDRRLDRSATERIGDRERLYTFLAPPAPDSGLAEQQMARVQDRAADHGALFDRTWERSARLYFASPDAADRLVEWQRVKARYRPQAVAATSDDALQGVLHRMLRERPPLRTEARGRAAVSSAHPVATEAGLEVMRRGGNVVDAAVAVSFALGVVEPDASGIGGYGEMVIALEGLAKPTLIEFMSRVPEEGGLTNTALLQNGRYPADGPVLANVPGTVAGMHEAWRKYGSGTLPWSELLAPAIRAARDGYVVSEGLATTLSTEREHFAKYDGSRALFFRNGEPLVAGDTLRNPDLAWTLEQIAKHGADGFYKGEVAKRWVDDIRPKGNAMKLTDLARYFAPERDAVSGRYRDYTIYSSAPPVSGGAELVARLNLLERFPAPKPYTEDAGTLHAMLSAWFLVPSSRNRIADPALWPVDVASIISKDTARARWACFDPAKALRPSDTRGDTLACLARPAGAAPRAQPTPVRDGNATSHDGDLASSATHVPCDHEHAREVAVCHAAGTTAFTVADNEGNAVAVTQTLGTWGGNFYVTPGLGFLSNDKLTSYGTDPALYGSRLPFARHGSTLAPAIAFKGGKPVFAVGAAGNAWITSAVYQALVGALDFGLGPQRALELPRFLPGGGGPAGAARGSAAPGTAAGAPSPPYTIQLEDGFAPAVLARLRELGYELSFVSLRGELREGYGAAVRIDGKTVTAGADPRRSGAAGAIR